MAEARPKRDFTDLAPWIYTITLFALWEAASRGLNLPVYILPAPSVVAQSIVDYWPAIWKNSLQTLYTTLAWGLPWRSPAGWRSGCSSAGRGSSTRGFIR